MKSIIKPWLNYPWWMVLTIFTVLMTCAFSVTMVYQLYLAVESFIGSLTRESVEYFDTLNTYHF